MAKKDVSLFIYFFLKGKEPHSKVGYDGKKYDFKVVELIFCMMGVTENPSDHTKSFDA